jgi:glycine/D-amino acid oxidase-like deaminating enzyme
MIPNSSPWIQQLKRTRPVVSVDRDLSSDVVIVGGGIAGVVTAFFTLRNTKKNIIILEADKVAHGATGHNAGQITSYFERPLTELVEEFGFELTIDSQRSVESGWTLLDQIISETGLQTPLYRFTGYAGLSSLELVLEHLRNNRIRVKGGLPPEALVVAKEWDGIKDIPKEFNDLYSTADHDDVLQLLETHNRQFIASLSYQKGCMNSALFSEELITYLLKKFADRFQLFEGSPVKTVALSKDSAALSVLGHTVTAKRAVLCTNGFENFTIKNEAGPDIDPSFHHSIAGRIGYMAGYFEPPSHPPTAISYLPSGSPTNSDPTGENYFYLTRRPHEHEGRKSHSLVCIGGPEKVLPNGAVYSRTDSCSEDMRWMLDEFLKDNYDKYSNLTDDSVFCWHGLMGYTPNGIRRVGPEPCNPVLLYNLGCNGVGILPSIFGGHRISRFLNGEKVPPSIFDPHDQRESE